MKIWKILPGVLLAACSIFSQNDSLSTKETVSQIEQKLQGLEESYIETKGTVEKLKKIKISGYIQAQMRIATDTSGQGAGKYKIGKFQGGDLQAGQQSTFQVRRGRLKVAHESSLTQMVIQLDCVPKAVSIKDAYFRFADPWTKSIALKAGVFDRPFGFEISYSSSTRESPERSRLFQTLFPGERDMGLSLEYTPTDNFPLWAQLFNVKAGVFAGNGINDEFDDTRDIIGRLGISIPVNKLNLSIDAGFSGYRGAVKSIKDTVYTMSNNEWIRDGGNKNEKIGREYLGGDLQLYYGNIPLLGGISLRGEVIGGKQPGRKNSSESIKSNTADTTEIYKRDFFGFYVMGVMNLDPVKSQLVAKYDFYDPNVNTEGNNVTSIADAYYKTLGLGLIYHWNSSIKLMAYYDIITNEKISLAPYTKDVNDNVLTIRIQYKF
ncbi:MAG: porin [Fibrobacter sp.]|nr:porin [Fibrobacter sp.]